VVVNKGEGGGGVWFRETRAEQKRGGVCEWRGEGLKRAVRYHSPQEPAAFI